MKKLMSTLGILAILFGTGFAQEKEKKEEGSTGKPHAMKERSHRMFDDIPNLTDKQKEEIKEIKKAARKEAEPQRKEVKALRQMLFEMKTSDKVDLKEINQLIEKTAMFQAELEKSKVAAELDIRKILTDEQKKEWDENRKSNMEMREKKHMMRIEKEEKE